MVGKTHEDTMQWMYARASMFGPYEHERGVWDREWEALSVYDRARVEAVGNANRFSLYIQQAEQVATLRTRCEQIDEAERTGGVP